MTTDSSSSHVAPLRGVKSKLPLWAVLMAGLAAASVLAGLWFAAEGALEAISLQTIGLNYGHLKRHVAENTTQAAFVYVGAYTMLGALVLPGSALLVVASGLFFGTGLGIPLSILASMMAAMAAFLLARTALGARMAGINSPLFARFRAGFARHALSYMMFLRLTPGLPFAGLNVLPSLIGVPLGTFAAGTFLGLLPSRIALSTAGAGLGSAIETQNALYSQCLVQRAADGAICAYRLDVGTLLTNEMVAAFVALAVLALVPAIIGRAPRLWLRMTLFWRGPL